MRILAHRGSSLRHTENTPEAFGLAREEGADGIELDVRLCGSGEVVVFHDATLERLAGDPRRVGSLSLPLLREVEFRGGGRICTLEEAYEAAGPELQVNVELKVVDARPTGLEAATARAIARIGGEERTLISCFHPLALWRMRRLASDLPRALLFGTEQARLWQTGWQGSGAGLAAVHPEASLATGEAIARWRGRGLAVNVWTVDAPQELRRLHRDGATGVITNDPALARQVLAG